MALALPALSTLNSLARRNRVKAALLIFHALGSLHAAVLTVTSLADSGPGSLRDQVAASLSGDTIQFAVTGTILLSSAINIPDTLYVQGPGPSALVVDANHVDRAFITGGVTNVISGMTITNGLVTGLPGPNASSPGQNGGPGLDADGGAILDQSMSLVLSNCWLVANSVEGGQGGFGGANPAGAGFTPGNGGAGGAGAGGALYATSDVYVVNCTFSANRATGGVGGVGGTNLNPAVVRTGGTGGAGGSGQGGAVNEINAGNYNFNNSTFSANRVGGGLGGQGGDSLLGSGGQGGIGAQAGGGAIATVIANFTSCTIVSNSAFGGSGGSGGFGGPPGANGTPGSGTGGGVVGYAFFCLNHIANTILADNYANGTCSNYFIDFADQGYNFIGSEDVVGCGFVSSTMIGTIAVPIHPELGPLAQNGGGLPTHASTLSSPVTDAGTNYNSATTDERGAPRTDDFLSIPNAPGGDGTDIGAFELGLADLGLVLSNNNAVVSWPAYYGDFLLQSATNLQGSNNWSTLSNNPVLIGGQFIVTNHITDPIRFFRLVNH